MRKREIIIVYMLVAAFFLISGTVLVSAENYDKYGVFVNDTKLEQSVSVFVKDEISYLSLKNIKSHLGWNVTEDKNNNIVTISDKAKSVKIIKGVKLKESTDAIIELQTPLLSKDNEIFIPVTVLTDLFGYQIEMMDDIKCLRITTTTSASLAGKLVDAELNKSLPRSKAKSSPYPKVAYLTFDDGLDRTVTRMILDILKEEDVKATFFIVGNTIPNNKALLKRMVQEGHSIGNHTYTHRKENIYSSGLGLLKEIERTNQELYNAVGIRTNLFRPPYGGPYIKKEEFKTVLVPYRVVLWNVDSKDSLSRNIGSTEIYNNVVAQVKNKTNANIIMHDSGTHMETVKALPAIIKYLKENGFTILPIK